MSQHSLQGRTDDEVLWTRRRSFLQAAAAWTAAGGFAAAHAQQRSNVVELRGEALLNGRPLRPQQTIQTGDRVETGPGGHLVFVVGPAAFHLRQDTSVEVERGATLFTVSVLRILTGAVASVWGRGAPRQVVTPTLTAGIRGTGVYTEVRPQENLRSYFCNCYGTVELSAGRERTLSRADYHQSFWAEPERHEGPRITPARAINHTDEELEFLARLVGEPTAWQVAGRRGAKEGTGYMDPAMPHPLLQQQPRR